MASPALLLAAETAADVSPETASTPSELTRLITPICGDDKLGFT
jgi:hypothetical protein